LGTAAVEAKQLKANIQSLVIQAKQEDTFQGKNMISIAFLEEQGYFDIPIQVSFRICAYFYQLFYHPNGVSTVQQPHAHYTP